MGKAAVVISSINGKVESKLKVEKANLVDLSVLYVFLDNEKSRIMEQIKKMIRRREEGES